MLQGGGEGHDCLPQTSQQSPGEPPVWAAASGDSFEGWTQWGEGQVKDFKKNSLLRSSRRVGRRQGCCFDFFLLPDPHASRVRLEHSEEAESRWEAGLVCCSVFPQC